MDLSIIYFLINNKVVISSKGVEWLSKNVFKKKYLELLRKYKMQLTELYIEKGYIYDKVFVRNQNLNLEKEGL